MDLNHASQKTNETPPYTSPALKILTHYSKVDSTMYTYRDVKSGEAYRGLLESLDWKKPRKKEATFTKTYPNRLLFEAYFGYATFNHYPGNFSGIPVFRVISMRCHDFC